MLVLIENKSYNESLVMRASCDITFDQLTLCYGNSGLEGMCYGQATIVGMSDSTRNHVNQFIGYEPFAYATESTLEAVLLRLIEDKDERNRIGSIGKKYVTTYHSDDIVAKKLVDIYSNL